MGLLKQKAHSEEWASCFGADDRNRTDDIRITNAQKLTFIGVELDSADGTKSQ